MRLNQKEKKPDISAPDEVYHPVHQTNPDESCYSVSGSVQQCNSDESSCPSTPVSVQESINPAKTSHPDQRWTL